MNAIVYTVTLCLVVPFALSHRETRAIKDCNGQSVPNVCPQNEIGTTRLPHPTDSRQFLMCEQGGRMYVVRCPDAETFDNSQKDCTSPQTPAPTFNPYNPCTADKIADSQLYFPYPGDSSRYIECRGVGLTNINVCPLGQVYEPRRRVQGCVATIVVTTMATQPTPKATQPTPMTTKPTSMVTQPTPVKTLPTTAPNNPCDLRYLTLGNLYFADPSDRSKFIQCDFAGNAYIMQCPDGLVWNQFSRNCIESVISG